MFTNVITSSLSQKLKAVRLPLKSRFFNNKYFFKFLQSMVNIGTLLYFKNNGLFLILFFNTVNSITLFNIFKFFSRSFSFVMQLKFIKKLVKYAPNTVILFSKKKSLITANNLISLKSGGTPFLILV